MIQKIGYAVIICGVISCLLFIVAGAQLGRTGSNLTFLRSQGGESVAEVYYQQVGAYGLAYSKMSYAFGFGVLAVSLGIGAPLILKKQ